uniref:Uncharacterized protein n=1 Tax=Tetradesmus obliquus TaxID=3088 RepID=A0A383WFK0_TETOB|eukprot:jgi/Sobl393_1/13535/SZX68098.1
MYVPSDSFGGLSPERKASQALQSLFTFISAKIVLAQLEGSGRGALASYNQEQYKALFSHLQEASLSDPHAWLEQLMRKDKALALRLMEVRAAYSKTDFEWDQLQRLSVEALNKSNLQLMREAATASLQATTAATAEVAVTGETAESTLEQEQPVTAVTAQEQQQGQQEVPEQEQQAQPANTAPAAEASSNSAECEDTSKEAAVSDSGTQTPSSNSQELQQQQEQ